jgi:hypothetical protein
MIAQNKMEDKKMKRTKRLLAILLSALMICSTMVIPSFAEGDTTAETTTTAEESSSDGETDPSSSEPSSGGETKPTVGVFNDTVNGISTLTITKVLDIPSVGTVPNLSFFFEMSGATVSGEKDSSDNEIQSGVGSTMYARVDYYEKSDAVTGAVASGTEGRSLATTTATFSLSDLLNATDTDGKYLMEAGKVYCYTIKEIKVEAVPEDNPILDDSLITKTDTAGMVSYDSSTYKVYLYVAENTDGARIISTVIAKDSQGDKSELKFRNTLNTYDLEITKRLAGNYVNYEDEFTFQLKIPAGGVALDLKAGDTIEAYKKSANGTLTELTGDAAIKVGGEQTDDLGWNTFTLKGNESLILTGLPAGMIYYVKETNSLGYFSAYAHLVGAGAAVSDNTAYGTDDDGDPGQYYTIESGANIVAFRNTRNQPNTGIRLDVIPYVIVFAGAAFCAVMFTFKKKKSIH